MKTELEDKLVIGAQVLIGKKYAQENREFKYGQIINLVEGIFEYDNGLYTSYQKAPSLWDKKQKDFYSIYHLFGNNLERFNDCKVL